MVKLSISIITEKNIIDMKTLSLRQKRYSEKNEWKEYLYPEFSKIKAIIVWGMKWNEFKTTSFTWDEKYILNSFFQILSDDTVLIWHNLFWYIFQFLAKRSIINWIEMPKVIDVAKEKPRLIKHIDIMKDWQWLWRVSTSLEVIANTLHLPILERKEYDTDWLSLIEEYEKVKKSSANKWLRWKNRVKKDYELALVNLRVNLLNDNIIVEKHNVKTIYKIAEFIYKEKEEKKEDEQLLDWFNFNS